MKTIIPYKQLMTPRWIDQNAEKTGPYNVMPEYYEIVNTTGSKYQRALWVELVPLVAIITSTSSCTVTIAAALDPTLALTHDHDPIFAINNKKSRSVMGFQIVDVINSAVPCFCFEGDLNEETLKQVAERVRPMAQFHNFFQQDKIAVDWFDLICDFMQFRPAEKWGSCHTEEYGRFLNIATYRSSLDPSNGL